MDKKPILIEELDLSVRSKNALLQAEVRTLEDLLEKTEDDLEKIRNLGTKSIKEILAKIKEFHEGTLIIPGIRQSINFDKWLEKPAFQKEAIQKLKEKQIKLDVLENVTLKTYKALQNAGYTYMYQIAFKQEEEITKISGIDKESAKTLIYQIKNYLTINKASIFSFAEQANILTAEDIMENEKYKESIQELAEKNDTEIEFTNLSVRAKRILAAYDYKYVSEILFLSSKDFKSMKSLGRKTKENIQELIREYIKINKEDIIALYEGKGSSYWSERKVYKELLVLYDNDGFKGLTYEEIKKNSSYDEDVIAKNMKKLLDAFIREENIYLKDGKYYCIYPNFKDYLKSSEDIDDRSKEIILMKLDGYSLEEIGDKYNFSRTNSQRLISRGINAIKIAYYNDTGKKYFEEDRYGYIYETYNITKAEFIELLGIEENIYNYLSMNYERKRLKEINHALIDDKIPSEIKEKVLDYLRRDMVMIDGIYHEKKFWNIVKYAVKQLAKDDIHLDEFVKQYNNLLKENGISEDTKLYIREKDIPSCINHLMDTRYLLWKQFHTFRYYNIDQKDYKELIEGLYLSDYEDTEISTLKLFNAYPKLMEQYDIKDHYELHNLLRKIIPKGSFNEFSCSRMPTIKFGSFDKEKAFLEIIVANSPISTEELVTLIHAKFGYEKSTIYASYLSPLKRFCSGGTFVASKRDLQRYKGSSEEEKSNAKA